MLGFIKDKFLRKIATWIIVIIAILILNPLTLIQSHERGLLFTLGSISNKVLEAGVHFRFPFLQRIERVPIRPIEQVIEIEVGQAGAITKDNQTIGAELNIYFAYKKDWLVVMWKDYGKEKIQSLVNSGARECFKNTVGQYTIFELPMSQETVRKKTLEDMKEKLSVYPIDISELRVVNYDWSEDFDTQIKATMEKAQQVKQKEQELKIAEYEAQKSVKVADAAKASAIAVAEGQKEATRLAAEAKVLEGEGLKKFNGSIRATQDVEIKLRQLAIDMERVKKWNGVYVANNNYGPIPVSTGRIQGE